MISMAINPHQITFCNINFCVQKARCLSLKLYWYVLLCWYILFTYSFFFSFFACSYKMISLLFLLHLVLGFAGSSIMRIKESSHTLWTRECVSISVHASRGPLLVLSFYIYPTIKAFFLKPGHVTGLVTNCVP